MPIILPQPLYFIRHGETDWNKTGRLQGQKDIPINGRGIDQAESVGRQLKKYLHKKNYDDAAIAALSYIASPLDRTQHTMRLVRGAMGLDPHDFSCDPCLMELSFGAWEGLGWDDVKHDIPAAALEREKGKWTFQPPGGESYAMLAERVKPFLLGLTQETIVVSHGGVARVFLTLLSDLAPHTAANVDIWQGRFIVFDQGRFEWV
jgi:probable phosphoglycerate mutase